MALQTEILSTETSDLLKQIIFLKSFKLVFFLCYFQVKCSKSYAISANPDQTPRFVASDLYLNSLSSTIYKMIDIHGLRIDLISDIMILDSEDWTPF